MPLLACFFSRNETNLHSWMHCLISSALQSLRRALYIAIYHKKQKLSSNGGEGIKGLLRGVPRSRICARESTRDQQAIPGTFSV